MCHMMNTKIGIDVPKKWVQFFYSMKHSKIVTRAWLMDVLWVQTLNAMMHFK